MFSGVNPLSYLLYIVCFVSNNFDSSTCVYPFFSLISFNLFNNITFLKKIKKTIDNSTYMCYILDSTYLY